MKYYNIIRNLLIAFIATFLTSCIIDDVGHYTPEIYINKIMRNDSTELKMRLDDSRAFYWMDTMYVGDTATFDVVFSAVYNNLLSTQFTPDTNYAYCRMILTDDVRNVLKQTSDTINGELLFNIGYQVVAYQVDYIATAAGMPSLKLKVTSDSKFSPSEIEIRTPIAERK